MGFKTRKGKRMSLSHIYNILREPFYTGSFQSPSGSGKWYQGTYEPIITKTIFEKVQTILNDRCMAKETKPWTKEFDFTRLMTCGSCGSGVVAQEKFKSMQSTGETKCYLYYYWNRAMNRDCKEPYIREEALISQLLKLIDQIDLDELGTKKRLTVELERYQRFATRVLGQNTELALPKELNLKSYAAYLLKEGSRSEKREVPGCVKGKLTLQNKVIAVATE